MCCGVTFSAAKIKSPSFSRSSSSTTMTIRPALIASMASSMRASGIGLDPFVPERAGTRRWADEPLDVFRQDVDFDVYLAVYGQLCQRRRAEGVRNERHLKCAPA